MQLPASEINPVETGQTVTARHTVAGDIAQPVFEPDRNAVRGNENHPLSVAPKTSAPGEYPLQRHTVTLFVRVGRIDDIPHGVVGRQRVGIHPASAVGGRRRLPETRRQKIHPRTQQGRVACGVVAAHVQGIEIGTVHESGDEPIPGLLENGMQYRPEMDERVVIRLREYALGRHEPDRSVLRFITLSLQGQPPYGYRRRPAPGDGFAVQFESIIGEKRREGMLHGMHGPPLSGTDDIEPIPAPLLLPFAGREHDMPLHYHTALLLQSRRVERGIEPVTGHELFAVAHEFPVSGRHGNRDALRISRPAILRRGHRSHRYGYRHRAGGVHIRQTSVNE